MNFEGFKLEDFKWKKLLKIGLCILVGLFIIRMIAATLFFGEALKFVNDFNREFFSGQQAIHNKIEAEQEDFSRRVVESDRKDAIRSREFEQMDRGYIRNGKELAEYILKAKKDYELKLEHCEHDKECREYLNNVHYKVKKDYEEKLLSCQQDEECKKLLVKRS